MHDATPELSARLQTLENQYTENPAKFFMSLASALREAGEAGRAEEVLRDNLKRHPGYLSAHVLLGRCLMDRGAVEEATNEFHYVISVDPQNLVALRFLAEIAAGQGRPADAERWYQELLSIDPMNSDARRALEGLARTSADAATADQPIAVGSEWPAAAEAAGAASASDPADAGTRSGGDLSGQDGEDAEFGLIDVDAPGAEDRGASREAHESWGDRSPDASAAGGTGAGDAAADEESGTDFDAFGFGSVELGGDAAADEASRTEGFDDTTDVDSAGWLDLEPRQEPGEAAAANLGGEEAEFDVNAFTASGGAPAGAAQPSPADDGEDDDPTAYTLAGDGEDHPDDPEVVTETMAELYAAQGMPERAVELYRVLIQQRGEIPDLVRRLGELEDRVHATGAPAEAAGGSWLEAVDAYARDEGAEGEAGADAAGGEREAEARQSATGDVFADSFAFGFAGIASVHDLPEPAEAAESRADAPAAAWDPEETEDAGYGAAVHARGSEASAAAAAPVAVEASAAPESAADRPEPAPERPAPARTIGEYFRSLLTWTPGATAPPPPADASGGEGASGEDAPWSTGAEPDAATPGESPAAAGAGTALDDEEPPFDTVDLDGEPWSGAAPDADAVDLDFTLDEPEPAGTEAAGGEPPAAAERPEAEADAEEALPWEIPAEPAAEVPGTPAAADAAQAEGGGFSFEDFFGGEPEAPAQPAPEPQPRAEAVPAPVAEAPAPESPEGGEGGEEDEDLESFQAWLQSLKR